MAARFDIAQIHISRNIAVRCRTIYAANEIAAIHSGATVFEGYGLFDAQFAEATQTTVQRRRRAIGVADYVSDGTV